MKRSGILRHENGWEAHPNPSFPRRETFAQPSFPRRETFAQPSFPRRREPIPGALPSARPCLVARPSPTPPLWIPAQGRNDECQIEPHAPD